jgi:pimeloyl-ACP methyl ester carboxylesterase
LAGLLVVVGVLVVGGTPVGAATPPSLESKCGDTSDVVATPFFVGTTDGVELYSIDVGNGPAAIVLVHESPANLCGWLPYIPSLTAAGFRVLAFDLRGFSDSTLPAAVPARRTAAKDKRTALYPGGWHGWAIVETAPFAANSRALIAAWIRARS